MKHRRTYAIALDAALSDFQSVANHARKELKAFKQYATAQQDVLFVFSAVVDGGVYIWTKQSPVSATFLIEKLVMAGLKRQRFSPPSSGSHLPPTHLMSPIHLPTAHDAQPELGNLHMLRHTEGEEQVPTAPAGF